MVGLGLGQNYGMSGFKFDMYFKINFTDMGQGEGQKSGTDKSQILREHAWVYLQQIWPSV